MDKDNNITKDNESLPWRRSKQRIKIEVDHKHKYLDRELEVKLSNDGHHWTCFDLSKRDAERLVKKLTNVLNRNRK